MAKLSERDKLIARMDRDAERLTQMRDYVKAKAVNADGDTNAGDIVNAIESDLTDLYRMRTYVTSSDAQREVQASTADKPKRTRKPKRGLPNGADAIV